ncbi:uncharacterized protein B0P05DRAFT_599525 [Gilbertella persicaria]|uniref:uncharacterized protein n=1 Tax=Gilbertella persicaria TaxID=101096 RepID=UPI0022208A5C|nr:uncharacterized protein B0P05DRAFT_599525 [Gilbertella persicaria]KAI8061885.1 hypothetical protein B0P05DRAFT_599525 [Gilbertella persicaria]
MVVLVLGVVTGVGDDFGAFVVNMWIQGPTRILISHLSFMQWHFPIIFLYSFLCKQIKAFIIFNSFFFTRYLSVLIVVS